MKSDQHYLNMAADYAERGTCNRLQVGAVIVKFGRIVGVGWNDSVPGHKNCRQAGCLKNEQGRCIRTVHAEMNAMMIAMPCDLVGATCFTTHEPCESCTKHMAAAGIKRVVFLNKYHNKWNQHFIQNMEWVHHGAHEAISSPS